MNNIIFGGEKKSKYNHKMDRHVDHSYIPQTDRLASYKQQDAEVSYRMCYNYLPYVSWISTKSKLFPWRA